MAIFQLCKKAAIVASGFVLLLSSFVEGFGSRLGSQGIARSKTPSLLSAASNPIRVDHIHPRPNSHVNNLQKKTFKKIGHKSGRKQQLKKVEG
jgi:hypothetical protein